MFKENKKPWKHCPNTSSINQMLGYEVSRRDDLESLLYSCTHNLGWYVSTSHQLNA